MFYLSLSLSLSFFLPRIHHGQIFRSTRDKTARGFALQKKRSFFFFSRGGRHKEAFFLPISSVYYTRARALCDESFCVSAFGDEDIYSLSRVSESV